jgi:hypothetical protein
MQVAASCVTSKCRLPAVAARDMKEPQQQGLGERNNTSIQLRNSQQHIPWHTSPGCLCTGKGTSNMRKCCCYHVLTCRCPAPSIMCPLIALPNTACMLLLSLMASPPSGYDGVATHHAQLIHACILLLLLPLPPELMHHWLTWMRCHR